MENNKTMMIVGGIIVVALLAVVGWKVMKKMNSSSTNSPTTANVVSMKSYKDGTYEALGNYRSPGGPEEIDVSLTLKNNVVTDASVTPKATLEKSVHYQGLFAEGFKTQVVGKKISEINLGVVNGSSLTPKGFMDALSKVEAQAS